MDAAVAILRSCSLMARHPQAQKRKFCINTQALQCDFHNSPQNSRFCDTFPSSMDGVVMDADIRNSLLSVLDDGDNVVADGAWNSFTFQQITGPGVRGIQGAWLRNGSLASVRIMGIIRDAQVSPYGTQEYAETLDVSYICDLHLSSYSDVSPLGREDSLDKTQNRSVDAVDRRQRTCQSVAGHR
jgi:hypothetical protein